MDVWTELAAPHRHTGQAKTAGKHEVWRREEVWRRLVAEQESACDTERQEQGRGWTGAVWIPELWRELAQAEEQTGRAGSSEGWEGWSVKGFCWAAGDQSAVGRSSLEEDERGVVSLVPVP